MAKRLNFVNDIQNNDGTANQAVKNSVPTWANKTKVGGRSHDEILRLELELECAKRTMRAVNAERRKADRREAEQRHDYITALVAMAGKYSDAIEAIAASMNTVYSQVTPSGVASAHNARLRDEATCNANCDRDTLHIVEEETVQDASVREAKKKTAKKDATTTTAKTTAKKTTTAKTAAKKDATATTAKKTTTGKCGKGKYTSKSKKAVQYEEEYTVTAKNGAVYRVGHFHHTKTDEELWAVSAVEYSDEAKTWLKDTFGVYWSAYAGGFLFDYKPDTYLRRGSAKKTATKKTAKKNA